MTSLILGIHEPPSFPKDIMVLFSVRLHHDDNG
jgi:hypothetical protein